MIAPPALDAPPLAQHGHLHLSRAELAEVLTIALRAGQLMSESGANTARVEETVFRLGVALGAESLEVYVTPTGIIATSFQHNDHRTRLLRIRRSAIDLNRIALMLELSRQAERGELSRADVRAALEGIAASPRVYGVALTVLAVAVGCACFAALFGGGWRECGAVLLASGVGQVVRGWLWRSTQSGALTAAATAALASGLALLATSALHAPKPAIALIAATLLLVPGALLVSAIADLFRGDTISGMARITNALLVLTSIAAGIWTTLLLARTHIPLDLETAPLPPFSLALAFVATGGFAVLFDIPRRALPFAALVGALAYGARQALLLVGLPAVPAILLGGLAVGGLALLLARWLRLPTAIFSIPGFISLVPGVPAFRATISFVNGDYAAGTADLVQAALLAAALAAGLGVVNVATRVRRSGR